MVDKAVNAGVIAQIGFELQRNCALLLILDDYDFYKEKSFFICIEHHDDFLFAFTTNNHKTLQEVYTYQSKKKSDDKWTINADLGEIISKILGTGTNLIKDKMPKTVDYKHTLTFISNKSMSLEYTPNKKEKYKGKRSVKVRINETNESQSYNKLPPDIRDKINSKVKNYCQKNSKIVDESEYDNLNLRWIDFNVTPKRQKQNLIGLMRSKFPHVTDPEASIELFIELFKQVEQTYNQNNFASLLDKNKRLYAEDLKKTIDIIQTEQRTYEKWRTHAETFATTFKIPLFIQETAKDKIRETFEYLKDLTNLEHMKIQKFVHENDYRLNYYSLDRMFEGYIADIKKSEHINLSNVDTFFTCLCAYVEYYDKGRS